MAHIFLVRHGQTDFVGKKLCGTSSGIPLNNEGRRQVEKTASYLQAFSTKGLYSSPIQRAQETAQIISKQINLPVVTAEYLSEINFGDLQGTEAKKLDELPLWNHFLYHPSDVQFPNGDCVVEVQKRVGEGLDALASQFDQEDQLVCVAHGEVLLLAVAYAIHLPMDEIHHLSIDPASVTELEWTLDNKKLKLLNYHPE